ncbi:hypothetical protein [Rhodohalobacter mucosus]|uniref:Uncharacterized protein n=1 Tax=Rhodohalobacter mucosus TaxID=2079485 RepID=A0A316TR43_9BACT|nr:hypothetical protein [Rhodohalobacter mucosus]PWN06278.1 hypothetical protein DDZ15_10655 [Rhodohalobacter mucosus]
MHLFRKYGFVLMLLVPLLLGISIQHTLDSEHFAPAPVEQSQSDNLVNTLSETVEELSKEDDVHIRNTSFQPQAVPYSSGAFFTDPRARTVVVVPTPPPDLV